MIDQQLERALRALADDVAFPPTPNLTAAVSARLAASESVEPRRARFGFLLAPRFAYAALALSLFITLALATSPIARVALADALGLRGLVMHRLPEPPTAGRGLNLGVRVSVAEARQRAGFALLQPAALGPPSEVYVDEATGQVASVYPGPILFTQFRAGLEPGFFAKGLGPDTRVEQLEVNGGRAYWIEGRAHLFYYRDAAGEIRDESVRLAGNVLLWEQAGLTLRLEGFSSRDEALRLARSVG